MIENSCYFGIPYSASARNFLVKQSYIIKIRILENIVAKSFNLVYAKQNVEKAGGFKNLNVGNKSIWVSSESARKYHL